MAPVFLLSKVAAIAERNNRKLVFEIETGPGSFAILENMMPVFRGEASEYSLLFTFGVVPANPRQGGVEDEYTHLPWPRIKKIHFYMFFAGPGAHSLFLDRNGKYGIRFLGSMVLPNSVGPVSEGLKKDMGELRWEVVFNTTNREGYIFRLENPFAQPTP